MKKFIVVLIILFCSKFLYASGDLRNVSFIQVIESVKEGKLFEAKTWMKDGKVRMEYLEGVNLLVSIIKDNEVYNYNPLTKKGIINNLDKKTYIDQIGPTIIQSSEELSEFLDMMQAKHLGFEKVNGEDCYVYRYRETKNNMLNKIWIREKDFFPVKSAVFAGGDVVTIFYKDIELDRSMDDSLFDVPKDVEMLEYSEVRR